MRAAIVKLSYLAKCGKAGTSSWSASDLLTTRYEDELTAATRNLERAQARVENARAALREVEERWRQSILAGDVIPIEIPETRDEKPRDTADRET